jgi:hypothetical protein
MLGNKLIEACRDEDPGNDTTDLLLLGAIVVGSNFHPFDGRSGM